MTYGTAERLFAVLVVIAAMLMLWQSNLRGSWGWQGIMAMVLCVVSVAIRLKWVRCPHCGKPIARGAKTHCTYCGKPYEEEMP